MSLLHLIRDSASGHLLRDPATGHLLCGSISASAQIYDISARGYGSSAWLAYGYMGPANPDWDEASRTLTIVGEWLTKSFSDTLWEKKDLIEYRISLTVHCPADRDEATLTVTEEARDDGKRAVASFVFSGAMVDDEETPGRKWGYFDLTSQSIDDGGMDIEWLGDPDEIELGGEASSDPV